MAPRTKFSAEAKAEFLRHVRLGLPKTTAAALAGWGESTFERYLRQGREAIDKGRPGDPKARFVIDVAEAEAQCKRAALSIIVKAAQGTPAVLDEHGNVVTPERVPEWQAAIWLLERRFPAEFGPRRVAVSSMARVEVEPEADVSTEALTERVRHLRAVPDSACDDSA